MIEPGNSTTSTGTTQNTVRPTVPLTVGVEEEFLLVDARSLRVVPAAPLVLATADGLPGELHPEGTRYQVEISTPIAHSAASLRAELAALRRTLGRAARAHGCRLLAAPRRSSPWRGRCT